MKTIITVTEEPLFINPYIKEIIRNSNYIDKVYIVKGSVIRGIKILDKVKYLFTIAIICDPFHLIKIMSYTILFILFDLFLSKNNPFSLKPFLKNNNIPFEEVNIINSRIVIDKIKKDNPDVILNQAQAILGKKFLKLPNIGVINRHCALLPKYRGLLSPFWVCYYDEKKSGVTIHFVDQKIDNGPILIQRKFNINKLDSFSSVLSKCFNLAPTATIEALDLIKSGEYINNLIPNNEEFSSYYSYPKIRHALTYRKKMLKRLVLK